MPLLTTGAGVAVHEYSHAVAFKVLYGTDSTVQVDGVENFARIKEAKTLRDGLIALGHWLAGTDSNKDGAAGWCAPKNWGNLTPLGKQLGPEMSDALVSLAGTIGAELPLFPLFAVGSKIRNRHPFAGYSMMTLAMTSHALNMGYAWDAALMNQAELEKRAGRGHDFANAALQLGRLYKLDPTLVSKIVAGGFTAVLPAFALAVYLWHKDKGRNSDELIPDAVALAHLYRRAETDSTLADKLNRLLEQYPQRKALQQAESVLDAWLDAPPARVNAKALKAAAENLSEQMKALNSYLISKLSPEIRAARDDLRRQIGLATGQDTFEKAVEVASVSRLGATVAYGTLSSLQAATPVTAVLGKALPVLGVIPMAGTYYQTAKDLQNPQLAEKAKKYSLASSVLAGAGFVAMAGMLAVPGMGLPLLALGLGQGIAQGILARGRQKAIQDQIVKSVYQVDPPKTGLADKVRGAMSSLKNRLVG